MCCHLWGKTICLHLSICILFYLIKYINDSIKFPALHLMWKGPLSVSVHLFVSQCMWSVFSSTKSKSFVLQISLVSGIRGCSSGVCQWGKHYVHLELLWQGTGTIYKASEVYLIGLFEDVNLHVLEARGITLLKKEIKLARKLRGAQDV